MLLISRPYKRSKNETMEPAKYEGSRNPEKTITGGNENGTGSIRNG